MNHEAAQKELLAFDVAGEPVLMAMATERRKGRLPTSSKHVILAVTVMADEQQHVGARQPRTTNLRMIAFPPSDNTASTLERQNIHHPP